MNTHRSDVDELIMYYLSICRKAAPASHRYSSNSKCFPRVLKSSWVVCVIYHPIFKYMVKCSVVQTFRIIKKS